MDARTIKRNARNYVDWKQTRANLLLALMEAEDNKAKLAQDGYLETPHGFVNVEYPSDVYAIEYIGSSLNCPSGKYYTVDPCPRCHGSGHTTQAHECPFCHGHGSREAYEDQLWQGELDAQAEKHGLYWVSGEGDPLDQFLCMAASWSLGSD
jgi:hypothetical protein